MKLLILGAGASWGSLEGSPPARPKLTKELLPELRQKFPNWRKIPQEYAEAHDNDFERIMDAMLEGSTLGRARFLIKPSVATLRSSTPTANACTSG